MTITTYNGVLIGSDTSTAKVAVEVTAAPWLPTTPPGAIDLGELAHVTFLAFSAAGPWLKVSAVNPTSPAFPGGRGANELDLVMSPRTDTGTNKWGVEVPVSAAGVAGVPVDRRGLAAGSALDRPTAVPVGGYVATAHGTAADALLKVARKGATVLTTNLPAPPGTVVVAPGGGGQLGGVTPSGFVVEEWMMEWQGDPPSITAIPSTTNVLNLAFLQGTGQPVGWGSDGQAALVAGLTAFRVRGGAVVAGVGGEGGNVNTANRTTFVTNVLAYRKQLGGQLDGTNWDIEASQLNGDDVLAIETALHTAVPGWQTVLSPNGGNVDTYLPIAVRLHQAGLLTRYGQQFYDSAVSLSDAEGRIEQAVSAGLPLSKITVGMMIQSDSQHWTLDQCVTNMAALLAKYPELAGAYLWEAGRQFSAEWSAAMAHLFLGRTTS